MNLSIYGKSGKMGSYIYEALKDKYNILDDGDIVIDFTHADCAFDIIKKALEQKKKVISGTTNIDKEKLKELKKISIDNEASFIWCPNFAKGAVILYEILSGINNHFDDIKIEETHNIKKSDIPSGTAKEYAYKLNTKNIVSNRIDTTKAIHEIVFENDGEILSIKHEIINREAFMNGINIAIKIISTIDYVLIVGLDDFLDLLKIVD